MVENGGPQQQKKLCCCRHLRCLRLCFQNRLFGRSPPECSFAGTRISISVDALHVAVEWTGITNRTVTQTALERTVTQAARQGVAPSFIQCKHEMGRRHEFGCQAAGAAHCIAGDLAPSPHCRCKTLPYSVPAPFLRTTRSKARKGLTLPQLVRIHRAAACQPMASRVGPRLAEEAGSTAQARTRGSRQPSPRNR